MKKIGFSCPSNREDLSIHVPITTYCKTDIEARVISHFVVRTDRHDFGILIWKHVCTQK